LLEQVEAVIIAGGKDSSNTRRLFAVAENSGKPCALAEDSNDIPQYFYSFNTVGISAGASTPDSVIDEIERVLMN
jgi:4-hydroxy-3-methylbut-2-enyl diphosphate reductase